MTNFKKQEFLAKIKSPDITFFSDLATYFPQAFLTVSIVRIVAIKKAFEKNLTEKQPGF